jgi:hypothetical protein
MILSFLRPVANVAKVWFEGRAEKAQMELQAKLEIAKAKAAIAQKVATGELEWNQTMAEASSSSWKDEWLTILVSIPLILAFTGHEDIVMRGFAALDTMPDYYKTAVGVVFAASFGIQSVKNMMKK